MNSFFTEGVLLGLAISVSIGPVFLSIVESSLSHGPRMAICLATGVLVSDILLIALSQLFSNWILQVLPEMTYLKIVASLFFMAFGTIKIFRKSKCDREKIIHTHPMGYLQHFAKGIMVNGFNPALLIFWTSIVSIYQDQPGNALLPFFSGVLLITFTMDLIKSIFSSRISKLLSGHSIQRLIKISGFVFILFGIFILLDFFDIPVKDLFGI